MKLQDCTKEELVFIIKRLIGDTFIAQFKIRAILSEMEMKRTNKTLNEADNWAKLASDYRKQHSDVLRPYRNGRLVDVPLHIIKEAERYIKEAELCDRKWSECMRRLQYEQC